MKKITKSISQHVLLIDDNNISRRITSGLLTKANVVFTTAKGGEEGIKLIKENQFTLILVNVMMPSMDGYETTIRIRKLNSPKNSIPVIAVTSDNLKIISDKMKESGMNGFLNKPINIAKLEKIISQYSESATNILQHVDAESFNFDINAFETAFRDVSLRKDIVETFLNEESSDRERMKKAFASKVNENIYSSMHYMKGSFTYLKAEKILHLTQHILDLSKAGNLTEILKLEKPVMEYYETLLVQLKKYYSKF